MEYYIFFFGVYPFSYPYFTLSQVYISATVWLFCFIVLRIAPLIFALQKRATVVTFSHTSMHLANTADIPALVSLLNSAYRGEASQQGWTTEAHLIAGEVRTNEAGLLEVMQKPRSIFLKYLDDAGNIVGCVNLQSKLNKMYLGMFAVSPALQGAGIGKKILQAADEYARSLGSSAIFMTVISVRTELIDWYNRHGYAHTGKHQAFEEDGVSGKHLQPLSFVVLEKKIIY